MALDVPQTPFWKEFWNDKDEDEKDKEYRELLHSENFSSNRHKQDYKRKEWMNLICLTLPSMEHHLDGSAVAKMKEDYKWLEDLESSSTSGWERLKEEFFKNAPAFLDVLDVFTDWKRVESQMAAISSADSAILTKTLLLTCKHMEDLRRNTDDRYKYIMRDDSLAARGLEILDVYKPNDLTRSRLEDLFGKAKVASSKAHQYELKYVDLP